MNKRPYRAFSHGIYRSAHPKCPPKGVKLDRHRSTLQRSVGHPVSSSIDVDLCKQDVGVL